MAKTSNSNVKLFLILILCSFFASIIVCGSSKDEEGKMKNEGQPSITDSRLQTPDSGLKSLSPLEDNKPHLLSEFLSAVSAPVIFIKQADMNNDNLSDVLLTFTDNQLLALLQQPDSLTPAPPNSLTLKPQNSIYYLPTKNPITGLSKTDVTAEDSAPEFPEPVIIATEVFDVNKDGYNDIVTALAGTLNSPLQIQLGSQTGEFTDASNLLPNLDATVITKLKIADVNNDAYPDIILTSIGRLNYEGDKILAEFAPRNYVLLNSGNGAFLDGTAALFGEGFASTRAIDIQVRDFGVDGLNDVLLINPDGNLLYTWSAEISTMQSADASSFTNVPPSPVNNQSIQLDANGDGIVDTVILQDGAPSIIYDSAILQKPGNSLTPEPLNPLTSQPLNFVTSYVSPYQYKITGPSGLTIATVNQIGDVVYLEFSSRVPAYVWGNVLMTFDPAKLQCVSIEENPNNLYGFWVWWAVATGMPYYGGGGAYYYYDDTGFGSGWAKAWAHIDPGSGPTGTYDNTTGKIRIYTDTLSGYSYTSPLRIGFRVLQAGPADFTVQSNDYMAYDWNNVDAGTTSTVNITESGQSVYKEDVANNVRISISGPAMVEIGQAYTIDTWGEIITPFRPIGTNVYSWELYIDGALYQRRGFTYGEEHRRSWEFTGTTEGAIVYKFRFRDGSRVHGGYGWVEVEMTVNVVPPAPHIDSISPTQGPPGISIMLTGTNFSSVLTENTVNIGALSILPASVNYNGTVLTFSSPYSVSYGENVISITSKGHTSNPVSFYFTTPEDTLFDIISEKQELLNSGILTSEQYDIVQEAIKMLNGSQDGSQNGAIDLLNKGDLRAAVEKIEKAIEYLELARDAGCDMSQNIILLRLAGINAVTKSDEFSFKSYYAVQTEQGKGKWVEFSGLPLTVNTGTRVKFLTVSTPAWFDMTYEWLIFGNTPEIKETNEANAKSEAEVVFDEEGGFEIVCQGKTPGEDIQQPIKENSQQIDSKSGYACELRIIQILGLREEEAGNYNQTEKIKGSGRLFIDTIDDGIILDGKAYDKQRVTITVEIDFGAQDADISQYMVHWLVFDPDDPADNKKIDSNEKNGGDNTGKAHEGAEFWFEKANHQISKQKNYKNNTDTDIDFDATDATPLLGEAKTEISADKGKIISTVAFYYSDDGGDNFIIKARCEKKEGGEGVCPGDKTETLTVWRKRFVDVYAMLKMPKNAPESRKNGDDVQIFPKDPNKKYPPNTICITPGENSRVDTMILGGDDEYVWNNKDEIWFDEASITAGPNGIVESDANSGGNNFYPSNAGTVLDMKNYIRKIYSNTQEPDKNAYVDFEIAEEELKMPYEVTLIDNTDDPFISWTNYLWRMLHQPKPDEFDGRHKDNTYDIIGIARFKDEDMAALALNVPHVGVAMRWMRTHEKISGQVKDEKKSADVNTFVNHELGHVLVSSGDKLHNNHSSDCIFEKFPDPAIKAEDRKICEVHIVELRDRVSRSFQEHNEKSISGKVKELDSVKSKK